MIEQLPIKRWLTQHNSPLETERTVAKEQLLASGVEGIKALVKAIGKQGRRRLIEKEPYNTLGIFFVFGILSLMMFLTSYLNQQSKYNSLSDYLFFAGMILLPLLGIGGIYYFRIIRRKEAQLLWVLRDVQDKLMLGSVLEAVRFYPLGIPSELAATLNCLLPQTTQEDRTLLNRPQRKQLYELLVDHKIFDPDDSHLVMMNILRAVEIIGDQEALPFVEELSQRTNASTAVVNYAKQVAADLKARLAQEQEIKTLLRPADQELESAELLLRPADIQDDADQSVLLRPGEPQE